MAQQLHYASWKVPWGLKWLQSVLNAVMVNTWVEIRYICY